jgi:hypothetical protein
MDYKQAQTRVKALKGFYIHVAIYLSVIGFLFLIDYLNGGSWWFYWPAAAWGIGVVINGVAVFFETGILGPAWEEKKIKDLMAKANK